MLFARRADACALRTVCHGVATCRKRRERRLLYVKRRSHNPLRARDRRRIGRDKPHKQDYLFPCRKERLFRQKGAGTHHTLRLVRPRRRQKDLCRTCKTPRPLPLRLWQKVRGQIRQTPAERKAKRTKRDVFECSEKAHSR